MPNNKQWRIYIVKFSISCSFWEILAKLFVATPGGLAPPHRRNPGSATDKSPSLGNPGSATAFTKSICYRLFFLLFFFFFTDGFWISIQLWSHWGWRLGCSWSSVLGWKPLQRVPWSLHNDNRISWLDFRKCSWIVNQSQICPLCNTRTINF